MRTKIVAGNWKMNLNASTSEELLEGISIQIAQNKPNCQIIVAPAFPLLQLALEKLKQTDIQVYAQDMSEHISGAYTGEVSAQMLTSLGVKGVILGHSEQRQYHGQDDEKIGKKIKLALENNLTPIYCIGETLEQRENGKHFTTIETQISNALFSLSKEAIQKVILAYEPVWAIGTGKTASPQQAEEIHGFIREKLAQTFSLEVASEISILYGGSVNPSNAKEIFAQPNIDGGLIGGASLKAEDFSTLCYSF
ncbi:MAG: triose-phosphate isomerase [Flavobacteriaceae bacterium]|nr:MAG: triose-phosphate isomerase [Flavobacteriaceae bacterium]